MKVAGVFMDAVAVAPVAVVVAAPVAVVLMPDVVESQNEEL